ncbi:MAG: hypothetical protein NTU58_03985 [Candidatus Nealsonbacteria bacterium]|nr:hypothetical protein [Candidatus Nealsonbacteria bacterium]
MLLKLKEDYETHEDEIHLVHLKIKKIKKGAPIEVIFEFCSDGIIGFFYGVGPLKHMSLSMLELPKKCIKDENTAKIVFCATKKKFFYASYHDSFIGKFVARQMDFCPICGKGLEILMPLPTSFDNELFEVPCES